MAREPERTRRSRKSGAPDAPALTRESIVYAALEQIDDLGLDTFSMRNLATRLQVYPTAIYWYVPTKNELLALVVARVLRDIVPTKRRRSLSAFLHDLFRNYREAIRRHPNTAPLIGTQLVSNTNVDLEIVEAILAQLARAGVVGNALVAIYNAVIAALVGFTTQEFAPIPTEGAGQWQAQVRDRLAAIDRDKFPVLSANLALLSNRAFILRWESGAGAPMDESFQLYIELVVAGIEKIVERSLATP